MTKKAAVLSFSVTYRLGHVSFIQVPAVQGKKGFLPKSLENLVDALIISLLVKGETLFIHIKFSGE